MTRNSRQITIGQKFLKESEFDDLDRFLSYIFANTRSTLLTYNGNDVLYNAHNRDDIGLFPINEPLVTRDIITLARQLDGPFYINKNNLYLYEPIEICEMNLIGGNVKDFTKNNKSV